MVGAVAWGVKIRVRRALAGVKVPEGCPAGLIFVPEMVHTAVLQWGHYSKLTCHPGVRRSLVAIRQRFWW